jgi:hypothetical protein
MIKVLLAILLVCLVFGSQAQAIVNQPPPQAAQWGYFGVSGGGIAPSETIGGTDGAAVEFTGTAATTLWMGSFDLSDDVDESFEWSAWLPADYANGGALSDLRFCWITDDADLGTIEIEVQAKAVGDGDLVSVAYSSAVVQADTSNGANKMNIVTFANSLVPANSPQRGEALVLRFLIDESDSTINTTVYFNLLQFRYPRAG